MIRPERLTLKGQEAFRDAGELARARGNPVVNDTHLFAALLAQDEGIVQPLLQKAGLNVTRLREDTNREIARFPSQSGEGAEPGLSRELHRIFDRAEEEAKRLGDAYVSTEHLLISLVQEKGTTARQLLGDAGVTPDALLAALGEVLRDFPRALVATDDMYEHIRWDSGPFVNILNVCPDLASRTLVLNGVSKAYSMTGWRIGYAGGPAEVIKAMTKVQSQSTSNPTSISQVAAQAALNGPQDCIGVMLKAFKERHDFVVDRLNRIPGIDCLPTDGTFYVFPRVQQAIEHLPGINNDLELAEYLLERAGVALVPGSAFGLAGHVRISIATSPGNLEQALDRIATAVG